ncbi:MAG: hypothetical protein ACM3ML_37675 [Micromonosporaceae bacterium]
MSRAWWRAPGGALAAVMTAAVAATGCAANVKVHAAPLSGSKSPAATVATSTPSAAPAPQAASGDPAGVLVPPPPTPKPRCPALVHYPGSNAGPLFCTDGKDNPAALRYFTTLHLKIMGLPAGASQSQAITAICADLKHISHGTEYSAYLLAATREHWFFTGIAKMHGNLPALCKPSGSPSPLPGRS